ncbi:Zn-dependent oligopeptidase [Pseudomonas syringae pv. actinidiae]|uniref:Zn-dependent oligopeptidase n=1 Tax=Pseudomonas syringae pv. actinidiae TaxID=103796 RepID=A0A2V0QZA0_PSESF|nr:Zn-dependent oligopeptidase [Pseudomonas syringae pv. actinidiae]
MRAGDITRAEHQRLATEALKIRRFGAECYCRCRMTGETLGNTHKFSVGHLLERRALGEQRSIVDLHLMQLGQRLKLLPDGCTQRLRVHARQRAQVELQRTLTTDPVRVVAAMNAAQVQGRLRHRELRIAVFKLPLRAQALEFADRVVHRLQRAVAQARVGRMTAAPENVDALHHHAFVHADRLEPGRLADHRRTTQRASGFCQRTRAGHRAFFIAGGENQQRLLERLIDKATHGLDDQRKKALHVAAAQPDPAAIDLGELQGVGFPQCLVERHGIAVARQYQPAGACAEGCQQIELAGGNLLDIAGKTQVCEPPGQQIDDRPVGLVQGRLSAAHRRRSDQGGKLVFHGRQRHGRFLLSRRNTAHHRAIATQE